MGTIIEDLYDHEGYGAAGSLTDAHRCLVSGDGEVRGLRRLLRLRVARRGAPAHRGRLRGCRGRVGGRARPPAARPGDTDRVRTAINDAKRAVTDLVVQRPEAARWAVEKMRVWSEHMRRRLEPATAEWAADRMRRSLDALSQREAGGRGLAL